MSMPRSVECHEEIAMPCSLLPIDRSPARPAYVLIWAQLIADGFNDLDDSAHRCEGVMVP